MRPHYYCLPVLKREEHRRALVAAATSGSGRFFLGTDSAPHRGGAEGACQRLRRLLHRASARSSSTPRPSTPPARSTGSRRSPASTARLLRPAAQRRHGDPAARAWTLPEVAAVRRRRAQAAARRRDAGLAAGGDRHRERAMIDKPRIALPDRRRQLAGEKIGVILNELSTLRRDQHPARLRQLEEARSCAAGRSCCTSTRSGRCSSSTTEGQERDRHGHGHRRAGPALHRGPRRSASSRSDADFAPLVMHLRAKGCRGLRLRPAQKTPEPFVNACSRFLYLDKLATRGRALQVDIDAGDAGAATTPRGDAAAPAPTAELRERRASSSSAAAQCRRGARRARAAGREVGAVGQQIGNQALVRPAQLRLRDRRRRCFKAHPDLVRAGRRRGSRTSRARRARTRRAKAETSGPQKKATPRSRLSLRRTRRRRRAERGLTSSARRPGRRPASPVSWARRP